MSKSNSNRHQELAHFLRNRRERLSPKLFGLPEERRRTPGLRRGEVATLAGISLEWYTYLEQGRDINVSTEVLESLARTLQLNDSERKHLFLLAHRQQPPERLNNRNGMVSEKLQRLLDSFGIAPAAVMDTKMNILAWNASFSAVHGNYDLLSEKERNLLWITFTSKSFRILKGEQWEDHAKRTIAKFRAGFAKYLDDPWWTNQVEQLSIKSEEFEAYWQQYDVLDDQDAYKMLNHPEVGVLTFDHLTLQPLGYPELEVSVHIPLKDNQTENRINILMKNHS
ncbi:helix-turn-helix transcriptional regulator [Robertmurraya massiliosenegalensis]|uniref:helix-turn-helix transcriptional regulator n=1 Tax=Robertmurraya TaxID=2837507 RepID=UPI0039A45B44